MPSTYSPSLRLELIGDGDQSGIWGQTTNNNLGALLEQAISGVVAITMADANYTMSNYNGVVDEARNQVLVLAGALTATRNLVAPLVEKTYLVKNSTTGGQSVQIIGSSGLGVTIPNGITTYVYCDGTNFYNALSGSVGNFTINGNLAVTGTTSLTGALSGSTATFSGAISSVSPTFTGTPTAPTASIGTNTTQIATTAFTLANGLPSGCIVLWSGSIASIPSGWLLCNGSSGTPDLRDRFVVGAGSTYAVAATGGTADAVVVSHTHTASTTATDSGHTHSSLSNGAPNGGGAGNAMSSGQGNVPGYATTTGFAVITASTTVNSAGVSGTNQNLPPYYALAYIMKA
jgi:hypothetical protein